MKCGCTNCRYCKCYSSNSYWDPDEYECVGFERDLDLNLTQDQYDEIAERCWTNDEQWDSNEEPICPAYEENTASPEDEYWEKYAWEERFAEKEWERD